MDGMEWVEFKIVQRNASHIPPLTLNSFSPAVCAYEWWRKVWLCSCYHVNIFSFPVTHTPTSVLMPLLLLLPCHQFLVMLATKKGKWQFSSGMSLFFISCHQYAKYLFAHKKYFQIFSLSLSKPIHAYYVHTFNLNRMKRDHFLFYHANFMKFPFHHHHHHHHHVSEWCLITCIKWKYQKSNIGVSILPILFIHLYPFHFLKTCLSLSSYSFRWRK